MNRAVDQVIAVPEKANAPYCWSMGRCGVNSLTMTYFHTGIRTIIGAEVFHGPVRDGKEWDHLAMVVRLKLCCPALLKFHSKQLSAGSNL